MWIRTFMQTKSIKLNVVGWLILIKPSIKSPKKRLKAIVVCEKKMREMSEKKMSPLIWYSATLIPPSQYNMHKDENKSWSISDMSLIDLKCATYLRGGAQWRGKAGLFTPSLSGWASHPHALHGCFCRRGAVFCSHTSLSSLAALLCLLLLLSPAQTRGGIRVAPQRQDWVGYIPALMPGPYGWHVIGKSHHMRAGDWHAAAFTETGFPWGRGTRHLSLSWKRKWNKKWMAQKNRTGFKQLLLASIFGKKRG